MQMDQAKSVLRLPQDASVDPSTVAAAFHKMARRYPVEQFPERFSELRQAYELLSNPVSEIRSLMFDANPDLSGIFPPIACLNDKPQSAAERDILKQLGTILRYAPPVIAESLEDDKAFNDIDEDLFSEDSPANQGINFEQILRDMEQMLFGPGRSKKGKTRR